MEGSNWIIIIEDLAQLDLDEVYKWYEVRKPGLGEEFLDSLEDSFIRIKANPLHASLFGDMVRCATLKRFPYEVVYLINNLTSIVYVIAINHQHRKPGWFNKRT